MVPAYVLVARLRHQLETLRLHLEAGNREEASVELNEAVIVLDQLGKTV